MVLPKDPPETCECQICGNTLAMDGSCCIGTKITARPDGKLRGGVIQAVNKDGSVVADFPNIDTHTVPAGEWVTSDYWHSNKDFNQFS